MSKTPQELQSLYYQETASEYDRLHGAGPQEHDLALAVLASLCGHFHFETLLDVGAGTGRAQAFLSERVPSLVVSGVEPVEALRRIGHAKGIPEERLIGGDATALAFPDGAFDVVSAFGILHHIRNPRQAISEMLRVARRAIFLSDANNFAQGSGPKKALKVALRTLGLWNLVDLVKTRGKGFSISPGDGLAYSYSLCDDFGLIRSQCNPVHVFNTLGTCGNPLWSAPHLAVLGIKAANGAFAPSPPR